MATPKEKQPVAFLLVTEPLTDVEAKAFLESIRRDSPRRYVIRITDASFQRYDPESGGVVIYQP